ncbi:DUF3718 domain-containing protein [Alteromonas sp. 5E99-2]|uniref:DUF3718 domain-containing protein n=1 Tax=Alteromonas sp. 5E99-2 TaxID=2817683 RepID=UPI001A9920E9|nr:DUF3718 domain-containing protein [Alteromonas sp. 5E99-2]MBO1256584.1 DUF3718 domain-containing protein [Alteromonas sp. 5E99-2]
MKLSTLAIAITFTVASVQAVAQNVVLKPTNDDFETQACYTAATEGYSEAKRFIRGNGVNFESFNVAVKCNGVTIKQFARQFADNQIDESAIELALVAKDTGDSAKACIEAIEIGETQARAKYSLEGEVILCNHREISEFVRIYDSENIVIRSITEDE